MSEIINQPRAEADATEKPIIPWQVFLKSIYYAIRGKRSVPENVSSEAPEGAVAAPTETEIDLWGHSHPETEIELWNRSHREPEMNQQFRLTRK